MQAFGKMTNTVLSSAFSVSSLKLNVLTAVVDSQQNVVELFLLVAPDGPGKAVWDFVSDVVCEDLCQPNDPPVVLQEQKSILVPAFSVLQALYRCQDQWCSRSDTGEFCAIAIVPYFLTSQLNDICNFL